MGEIINNNDNNNKTHRIKVPMNIRILLFILIAILLVIGLVCGFINSKENTTTKRSENKENVYLYEEVEFADEIYIKVTGINATEVDDVYTLNLQVGIEQWHTDSNINQQEIRPNMFELRLVDKNASSPMSVFVESLARATVSAILSGAVEGEINVIEETVGFACDYVTGLIENSTSAEGRTIASNENAFEPFNPYLENGVYNTVNLSFVLNGEFLNSTQTMVLSIDDGSRRVQKNIFLVLRSDTKPYTIQFDLNGGSSNLLSNPINVEAGEIIKIPDEEPTKNGYKFLYWTLINGDKSTKLRDLYFHTYDGNKTFVVYAYYQPTIPLDEYINIGEDISLENGIFLIKVTEIHFSTEIVVKNSSQDEVVLQSGNENKYLKLSVLIEKTSNGINHTIDNENDFYLENDHTKKDVSGYYGYTKLDSLKPIDDYSWIGLNLSEIDTYQFNLVFEVPKSFNNLESLYFLEVDFFIGNNADSILIR